ncbi:hypothetical protein APHAL10511_006869 [Amanita phalloides]|nr:hypothetical protein APHAL10511_006869 [Amanita phalloides]
MSDEDAVVKYGGFVPDGESDKVEWNAAVKVKAKTVEDENVEYPICSLTDPHQGTRNNTLRALPREVQGNFEDIVTPLFHKKASSISPWKVLEVPDIQAIIDKVYGEDAYTVTEMSTWIGIMNGGFIEAAMMSVRSIYGSAENAEYFNSPEVIAEHAKFLLSKMNDNETFVFHWNEYNNGKKKVGYLSVPLITWTLSIAHLAKLSVTMTNFSKEKPVGALVEHVLNQWTTGSFMKSQKQFSANQYSDKEELVRSAGQNHKTYKKVVTYVTTPLINSIGAFSEKHWNNILEDAHQFVPKNKNSQKKEKTSRKLEAIQDGLTIIEDELCQRPTFIAKDDEDSE